MRKHSLKIAVLGLLFLTFSACFRKKAAISNLQDWLENYYPGRFQVISTMSDDAIRNLSFKVKNSVVAETANPLVQALVKWDKRQADLSLTTAMIDSNFAKAQVEWQDAGAFYEVLKKHGFENMAVSVVNGTTTVLLFAEPTPEARHEQLSKLEKALADWPAAAKYDKDLAFMEPSGFGKDFQDIVPLSYWQPSSVEYRKQMVFNVFCRYDRPFSAVELMQEWEFNTESDRFSGFSKKIEQAIQDWAKVHYKKPYYLQSIREYEQSRQGDMMLKCKFPFNKQPIEDTTSEAAPDGYFVVDFNIDKQTVESVKMSYE